MQDYIDNEAFMKGSKQVKRPSFRGLVLEKLGNKIANIEGVMKLVGIKVEQKKLRQALNNLARDEKVERRLVGGIVYYKKV